VWPSFWTLGPQTTWPGSGEIDIIEAINNQVNNQIALHTPVGCYQANVTTQSGETRGKDCSTDSGCLVVENKQNSYGKAFATAGGGVFALLIDASGVYSWFFSVCHIIILLFWFDFTLPQRANIPASIQQATASSQMDLTTWGIPTASYPNSTCDIQKSFPPQELVLLTTLCGVWYVKRKSFCIASTLIFGIRAGVPGIYRSTCKTPTGSCVCRIPFITTFITNG
jgi:hypothetical protein